MSPPGRTRRKTRIPKRLKLPRSLRATRAGWCFVAIVFGVGFAALNTGNNLLYLVLALLLAFLVLSGILSEASLRGLRVERRLPRELFAATPNRIALRIHNDHPHTPSFAVSVEDRFEGEEGPDFAGRAFMLRVGPRESVDRSYDFEPLRRGDLQFEGCRLSTRFPFGLFVKSVDLTLRSDCLVYPAISDRIPEHPLSNAIEDGTENKHASTEGDEVAGVREYAQGDSIQRINWRRTLRERRLIVGEREGESSAQLEVLLRLPATLGTSEIEERISQAASEIIRHLAKGYRVGLRTSQTRFEPESGMAQRTALLSYLAQTGCDEPDSLVSDASAQREAAR